ncbi:C4-dicarboxylate TRAP transporter substrate-binding protein [Brevibacillus sp. B_LB10_24]|uniref:C4-dicarboxylate TRAP transporter substrate-binding protein n=1 Tax=Brevibacillus sp. B_LB10_24 TaxID=3380645 RepID=UPI0038B84A55
MKKKQSVFIALCASAALLLGACGGGGGQQAASGGTNQEKDTTYVVKVSYENQPGEPIDLAANEWKRIAEEKSGGKLKLELYPSSALGSKTDVIEQGKLGGNVVQIADASFLADYAPDIGIISAPYLTEDFDQLLRLTKSDWFTGLDKELQGKGLHIVSTNWIYGERHLIAKKEVKTPADLAGMKIRVPNNKLQIAAIEKMGATPTPMPLGDVYPAVAQGVIDGMENPLPVIYGSKVYENAKFVSLTGHMKMLIQWVAGQKYIDTLPPEVLAMLEESADEAGEFLNKKVAENDQKTLDDLKANGVTVTEVDQAAFREAVKPVYSEFSEWSPGLHEKVEKIIQEGK